MSVPPKKSTPTPLKDWVRPVTVVLPIVTWAADTPTDALARRIVAGTNPDVNAERIEEKNMRRKKTEISGLALSSQCQAIYLDTGRRICLQDSGYGGSRTASRMLFIPPDESHVMLEGAYNIPSQHCWRPVGARLASTRPLAGIDRSAQVYLWKLVLRTTSGPCAESGCVRRACVMRCSELCCVMIDNVRQFKMNAAVLLSMSVRTAAVMNVAFRSTSAAAGCSRYAVLQLASGNLC